ncbi:hypothetical protein [Eubacterium ramulus]|uniref:hypothetical protein n=1 Tax=Eubacterium ramulus TaxID=39490 RepID=UPI00241FA992|nr:hypothetical protein [Eubacterium ramulus]
MFNVELKKEALRIHEETLARYNNSYEKMKNECENLYNVRGQAIKVIKMNQNVINSIANTPKEFDTTLGKIGKELTKFNDSEEYAKKAYNASVQAGINIAGGAAAGLGVASMAPTALMSIATTFGTASTGTAISTLSGCVAQKAALAWIGRTFAGFAAEGAGMAAGQAFLALAGPIGWGITAVSTGASLISLSNKNKELADKAVNEAKEISIARESLDEVSEKVNSLRAKTGILYTDMDKQRAKILKFLNADYLSLEDEDKYFLGTLVNNTLSLSVLLNETVQ